MGAVRWRGIFPLGRSTRQCKNELSQNKAAICVKNSRFEIFGWTSEILSYFAHPYKKWPKKRMADANIHNAGGAVAR